MTWLAILGALAVCAFVKLKPVIQDKRGAYLLSKAYYEDRLHQEALATHDDVTISHDWTTNHSCYICDGICHSWCLPFIEFRLKHGHIAIKGWRLDTHIDRRWIGICGADVIDGIRHQFRRPEVHARQIEALKQAKLTARMEALNGIKVEAKGGFMDLLKEQD